MYITSRKLTSYTKVTQMEKSSVCTCSISDFFSVAIEWEVSLKVCRQDYPPNVTLLFKLPLFCNLIATIRSQYA